VNRYSVGLETPYPLPSHLSKPIAPRCLQNNHQQTPRPRRRVIKHPLTRYWTKGLALSCVVVFLLSSWASPATAGGFTQPKGGVFSDLNFRTLEAGTFSKIELQAYVEYGLLDNLNLIIKSPYNWIENKVGDETLRNEGFIDQEVGLRWRLNRDPWLAVAVQGSALIPSGYDANHPLPLGRGVVGAEFRVPLTRSYQLGKLYGYGSVEAAYRKYFGPQSDEVRLFAELSVPLIDRVSVDVQIDHRSALEDDLLLREEETDLTKLIGHVRVRLIDQLTLGLGGYTHIRGSSGAGVEVQLWYRFKLWP
jgi:hypothetical protein